LVTKSHNTNPHDNGTEKVPRGRQKVVDMIEKVAVNADDLCGKWPHWFEEGPIIF
jgi:hypothetical protein